MSTVSGQFSIYIVVVSLGLHLFDQVFWHIAVQPDQQVAKEVWLVELTGMLACTALGLHCGVTSAVFAGVCWCGVLGIIH